MKWHKAKTSNGQGLIIDDETGANIAVTYDEKHADIVAAAPEMLKELKSTRLMLYAWRGVQERQGWGPHPELERTIRSVESIINEIRED